MSSHAAEPALDPLDLPLPVLASQTLAAFTIEVDNEFEHEVEHRTTAAGTPGRRRSGGPWLVSTVMWANCLRHVPDEAIDADELEQRAKTPTPLGGMRRWGWVTVDPPPRNAGTQGLRRDARVELTRAGRLARDAWPELLDRVTSHWRERGGAPALDLLAARMSELDACFDPALADCLPIVRANLAMTDRLRWSTARSTQDSAPGGAPSRPVPLGSGRPGVALYAGLSRLLLTFALQVEESAPLAMAVGLNVSRVLSDHTDGIEMVAIPAHSGLAKEAVDVSVNLLVRQGLATVGSGTGRRLRVARPTDDGLRRQRAFVAALETVTSHWATGPTAPAISDIRSALVALASGGERSVMWQGLAQYPEGWRAKLPARQVLPWFPMTTHRGGYPDGS